MSRTKILAIMAFMPAATTVSGIADAVVVQPVTSVVVVDSHHKRLGLYSPADKSVLMLFDQTMHPVRVDKNGFNNEWEALFAAPDCTGTPYVLASEVEQNANDLVDVNLIKQRGSVIWAGDPDTATTAITMLSRGSFDRCSSGDGLPAPGTAVLPLKELVDLNTVFTPPFHLIPK